MRNNLWLLALLPASASAGPAHSRKRADPSVTSVTMLGNTTSNLPNIYRDGGGGGSVAGRHLMMFSDGLYTTGGPPAADGSNVAGFTSNSIACSDCDGKGITSLEDFGSLDKGPVQAISYFTNGGENDFDTGIWPNQGIATLCDGACGVSFPQVVNRTAIRNGEDAVASLYNTGVQITWGDSGPVATRPTQSLFKRGEPNFGTFGTLVGVDGYLYLFAIITKTAASNGMKMARVSQGSWADRSQYQYWDGSAWVGQIPTYDDGGKANIFNYTEDVFGTSYGPGTGRLFFSVHYRMYLLMFQADAGIDNNGTCAAAYLPTCTDVNHNVAANKDFQCI